MSFSSAMIRFHRSEEHLLQSARILKDFICTLHWFIIEVWVTYLEEDKDEEELIDNADTQPKPPVSYRETQTGCQQTAATQLLQHSSTGRGMLPASS